MEPDCSLCNCSLTTHLQDRFRFAFLRSYYSLMLWCWEHQKPERKLKQAIPLLLSVTKSCVLQLSSSTHNTGYTLGIAFSVAHEFIRSLSSKWIFSILTNLCCILSLRGNSNSILPVLGRTYLYGSPLRLYNLFLAVVKRLQIYRSRDRKMAWSVSFGSQAKIFVIS